MSIFMMMMGFVANIQLFVQFAPAQPNQTFSTLEICSFLQICYLCKHLFFYPMTLQQLEYIVAVAKHRHFLKAAEACDVTQPTLSSMVQKLEEELGIKIFDRRQKPLALTAVGQTVVEQAQGILAQARHLRESVEEARGALTGTFRIGVLPTIAPYLIPRFFPTLTRQHPQLDLRIREMKTSQIKQALMQGEIDAGILALTEGLDDFTTYPLFYEQYFVYAAQDTPLHQLSSVRTDDLRSTPLWLLDEGHCFRDQLVKFCQLKGASHSQTAYKLGSIETFMRIVESGMGATFIPELCMMQLSEEQRHLVRPFAVPVPVRQILFATAPDCVRHRLVEMLMQAIRSSVPAAMHQLTYTQRSI